MKETKSRTSFAEMVSKNKKAIIIPIILAIMVGHFAIQTIFISDGKEKVTAPLTKIEPTVEQNTNKEFLIVEKREMVDENLPAKPLNSPKEVQPINVSQREITRQIQNAPAPTPLKREVKRDAKSERLRRAEKILTGF